MARLRCLSASLTALAFVCLFGAFAAHAAPISEAMRGQDPRLNQPITVTAREDVE
jgi:hypothetical protein